MDYINKGMTNSLVFTLNEKRVGSTSSIFINFYSNQDHIDKLMWLNDDISPNPIRWNEFEVEETINEDLNNQKIELEITSYDYFVYETFGTALSIGTSSIVLESGKIIVEGISATASTFDDPQDEYTFQ